MPRGKNDSKPRGKINAYVYFTQTCREEHKRIHPNEKVSFGDFARKCSERWKTMGAAEKQRFEAMAARDKQRHETEMQYYVPPKGAARGGGKKRSKDPNAPKRPLSGFFWFCHDERAKIKGMNPDFRVGDVAKVLGRLWAEAGAEVKSKYESMAQRDKARYEMEMAAYKQNGAAPAARQGGAQQYDEDDDEDDDDEDDDE